MTTDQLTAKKAAKAKKRRATGRETTSATGEHVADGEPTLVSKHRWGGWREDLWFKIGAVFYKQNKTIKTMNVHSL